MSPTRGLVLADLGADEVKVEPAQGGDRTRRLPGSGAGILGTYNRNKRSISVNLKSDEGLEFATDLVRESYVLLENFGTGVLDRLGLGYDAMQEINPGLVYCALKGFLNGPYEQRAGASVNDVMGGLFGVIAIQAALWERQRTGKVPHPLRKRLSQRHPLQPIPCSISLSNMLARPRTWVWQTTLLMCDRSY